jgi:hypothetical protein
MLALKTTIEPLLKEIIDGGSNMLKLVSFDL